MQENQEMSEVNFNHHQEISNKKQYLINENNFQLVKQCQQAIYEATESSPSIRKIINELITEENLRKITTKFIEIWKY